ncbi:hypothetical protein CsSME_00052995 [Camellia sinensis var. sinensis]
MGHFPSQRFILTIFMSCSFFFFFFFYCVNSTSIFSATHLRGGSGEQPLSKIAIHNAVFAIHSSASITASPFLLGKHVYIYKSQFFVLILLKMIGLESFLLQILTRQPVRQTTQDNKLHTYAQLQ